MKIPSGPTLPEKVLIIAHPLDVNLFLSLMPKPEKKQPVCLSKLYLFPTFAVIGPCLGGPQMLLILEHLFAWGAKNFLFWGWCGGLQSSLKIGDIMFPEKTQIQGKPSPSADPKLFKILQTHCLLPFFTGTVFSVDNPYTLDFKTVTSLRERGVLAIDMETEALFTWSAEHGTKTAAMLIVSDLFSQTGWKPGFSQPAFKHKRQQIAKELSKILTLYSFK
ncbi:MAG: hypothetical protein LWW94_05390 [Candidatus Desulfofervidaceae bacterium]|nr:hypothetical protein [Candidatus Desulfofervidaceae bacterium]